MELQLLQREADRLGVPWTHKTTTKELRRALEHRKGIGPAGLQPVQDAAPVYDSEQDSWFYEGEPQPECFGVYWEAAAPGKDGAECRDCGFQNVCMDAFANGRLREALETGPEGTMLPTVLSAKLDVALGAIEAAQTYLFERRPDLKKETQAKRGAAAAKRKVKREAERAKLSAEIAKAQGERFATETYSPRTFESRWIRERERSPAIAALTPGTTITTTYKGETYTCKVMAGYYQYRAWKYPTLYKVTEAAVKKGSSYSAPKFWKLGKYSGSSTLDGKGRLKTDGTGSPKPKSGSPSKKSKS